VVVPYKPAAQKLSNGTAIIAEALKYLGAVRSAVDTDGVQYEVDGQKRNFKGRMKGSKNREQGKPRPRQKE